MKVLIVDDSGTMRHVQRRTLMELGFSNSDIKEAVDGEDALKAAGSTKFDLILMDWNMPNVSGLDALKQLKANPLHQAIPVVMITSEAEKDHVLEAIKAGAANYILKPFSADKLREKIAPYIRK